jgi:hypothetical protein
VARPRGPRHLGAGSPDVGSVTQAACGSAANQLLPCQCPPHALGTEAVLFGASGPRRQSNFVEIERRVPDGPVRGRPPDPGRSAGDDMGVHTRIGGPPPLELEDEHERAGLAWFPRRRGCQ